MEIPLVLIAVLLIVPVHSLYKAAVVEFSIEQLFMNPKRRQEKNLEGFKEVLESVRTEKIDIIVFPEDGINGAAFLSRNGLLPFLEDIPDHFPAFPCTDSSFQDRLVLQTLSCLAREFQVVLVANMGDWNNCTPNTSRNCPPDGRFQFNTNVVFEKDGSLIAKYHKINLYAEEKSVFNPGDPNACVSFKTSFGVTFGTFTCFDMLFDAPSSCLLGRGVENFAFPTAWGNSYAFYLSVSTQQGWSREYGVNMLAANWHLPTALHGTGSGIYSVGTALQYMYSGRYMRPGSGRVLVSEVNENPAATIGTNVSRQVGIVEDLFLTSAKDESRLCKYLKLTESEGSVEVSYTNSTHPYLSLTCTLQYKIASRARKDALFPFSEHYALGVFIGEYPANFYYAVCTVLKCSAEGCGKKVKDYQAETVFEKLSLHGTFPSGSSLLPTILGSKMLLYNRSEVLLKENSMEILNSQSLSLLQASLWTRVYPNF